MGRTSQIKWSVLAAGLAVLLGCATNAVRAPSRSPAVTPEPAEPSEEAAVAEVPPPPRPTRPGVETNPRPPRKPALQPPEPLQLSDQQLERARRIQPLVEHASKEHGVDPNLLNGIIWRESKFNPRARNPSGARGLMQLMPVTGKAMAKKLGRRFKPYDPEFSVQAGAKLISIMLDRFDGDEVMALFAFARGGGSARRYEREGGPMPERVERFIAKVQQARATFEGLGFPEVSG